MSFLGLAPGIVEPKLEEALIDLRRDGYCRVREALSVEEVAALRSAAFEIAANAPPESMAAVGSLHHLGAVYAHPRFTVRSLREDHPGTTLLRSDNGRFRILVVDDDPSIADVIAVALRYKDEKVRGLELGDDYMTKPFSVEELLSRIASLLRRCEGSEGNDGRLRFADLKLDEGTMEVSWRP